MWSFHLTEGICHEKVAFTGLLHVVLKHYLRLMPQTAMLALRSLEFQQWPNIPHAELPLLLLLITSSSSKLSVRRDMSSVDIQPVCIHTYSTEVGVEVVTGIHTDAHPEQIHVLCTEYVTSLKCYCDYPCREILCLNTYLYLWKRLRIKVWLNIFLKIFRLLSKIHLPEL